MGGVRRRSALLGWGRRPPFPPSPAGEDPPGDRGWRPSFPQLPTRGSRAEAATPRPTPDPRGWAPNPPLRARLTAWTRPPGAVGSAPADPVVGSRPSGLGWGGPSTWPGLPRGPGVGCGARGRRGQPQACTPESGGVRAAGRGGGAHVGRFGVPPSRRLVQPERPNRLPRLLQPPPGPAGSGLSSNCVHWVPRIALRHCRYSDIFKMKIRSCHQPPVKAFQTASLLPGKILRRQPRGSEPRRPVYPPSFILRPPSLHLGLTFLSAHTTSARTGPST